MKKMIALVIILAFLFNGEVLSAVVKSYENYQVLRVEVASKEDFEKLSSIDGINFWNERMMQGEGENHINNSEQLRISRAIFM